jgi:short-subunit dehydrogenase
LAIKQNPVAIITGASKGIGRTCAIGLAKMGYQVVLAARTESTLLSVADEIRELHMTDTSPFPVVYPLDVTDHGKVKQFIADITVQLGGVDLLVNNAGISSLGTLDVSIEEFKHVFNVNVLAPFSLLREVAPIMIKQGKGHIINIASLAGKIGFPGMGVYAATKFGMVGLSESLYKELTQDGISVTTICPGWVNTDMSEHADASLAAEDMVQTEDIMNTIEWLLSLSPNVRVKEVLLQCSKLL